jgi:hypothetical protein
LELHQELLFIQSFVARERRERAQFELLSRKKRGAFLSRLCHTYDSILDMRYLKPIPMPNSDHENILNYLKHKHAPETCYVISTIKDIDGQYIPLTDALKRAVGFGLPSILICIPGKLGYFEAEQGISSPPRYYLER